MIEFAALAFWGILSVVLMRRLPPRYGVLALVALVVIVWVGAFGLFTSKGWWVKSFGIQLACVAAGLGTLALRRKGVTTARRSPVGGAGMVEYDNTGNIVRIGRFTVSRELGAGAMGKIYEAMDSTIQRHVAIKTIRDDIGEKGGERLRDRFMREAQAAGKLNHPNIVTIYIAEDAGPLSYIAMEYLEGTTLEDYIVRRAPLMLKEIVRLTAAVASALDYAHKHGVVHRDIKPANIMLTRDSSVKVMDFGIAYVQASTLTMDGAVLGTPSYMSPEQIRGEVVDGRSDIFSLGVVVYEMATRLRPFLADTLPAISQKILTFVPKRVSEINPAIPAAFDEVLAKALAKDRAERYQTAAEFAEALTSLQKQTIV
jgi:serine/threonine-protein kinase